ncbi:MAG: hypothetical protein ABI761_14730 [Saprospiraceae bacterium]
MKTFIYFISGITLSFFLLNGCSKSPGPESPVTNITPDPPPPTFDLMIEKKSPYNGLILYTATLDGNFSYPVVVNWYGKYPYYRNLNKTDTITSSAWNKSYYLFTGYRSLPIECEVIMTDRPAISKSINF